MKANHVKLFHVSTEFNASIKIFIPRVPSERAEGEDDKIGRICTSSSLNGCLVGHPTLWFRIVEYPSMGGCPFQMMDWETTLLDHGEIVGQLCKVYEFDVHKSKVITPHTLVKEGLVPDAKSSNEHWITEPITADRVFYLLALSANERDGNTFFRYKVYEESELGRIEDGRYYYNKTLKANY